LTDRVCVTGGFTDRFCVTGGLTDRPSMVGGLTEFSSGSMGRVMVSPLLLRSREDAQS